MDRALTITEQNIFRTRPQRSIWRIAVHKPASLYTVQISQTPVGHPASLIQIDNSTQSGDANLAKKNMTVWIGSIPGASEEGIVRLRESLGATSPTAMAIAESGSGLNRYYLGQHLTVVDEYRPVAKHPFYNTGTSQWLMDLNEGYTDQFDSGNYGPIVIMGPPNAAIMEGGTATMEFQAASSVFVDSTISSALWTFPDGQLAHGLETEAAPHSITFTSASPRGAYTSLRLTDNDGEAQTSRRLTWLFDDETQLPRVTIGDISGGVREGGYSGSFDVYSLGNQDEFPEGAEVVIFESASYGGNAGSSIGTNYPGREHIVMRGWIENNTVSINPFSGRVSFKVATIDTLLNKTHSHDVFHADVTPTVGASKWVEMENMSIDRVMIDIIKYRSTIAEVTDVHLASGLPMTGRINFQSLPKGSLWNQVRANYGEKGTRGLVSSDLQSNIYAMEDLLISGGSAGVPTAMHIRKEDRVDNVTFASDNFDVNSKAEMYGVMVIPGGSEWRGENTSIIPIGGESPGDVMGYYGGTTEHARGLVADTQDRIITWSGNWRAQMNSRYKKVSVPVAGNVRLDSVPQALVTMSLSSTENVRGISWVNKTFIPTGMKIAYNDQSPMTTIEMEEVVNGKGGSAITFPRLDFIFPLPTPTPPPLIPPPPPGAVVAFNSLNGSYLLDSVNKTWHRNDGTLIPFGDLPTAHGTGRLGNVDLWKSTVGNVYVTHNAKQRFFERLWFSPATWIEKKPGNPPGGNVDNANFTWLSPKRTNASTALTLAREEIAGTWNSWLGYTTDFGDSWSWAQIAAADTGAASWIPETTYMENASNVMAADYSQLILTHVTWTAGQGLGAVQHTTAFNDEYIGIVYSDGDLAINGRAISVNFDAGGSINIGTAETIQSSGSSESDKWMTQAVTSRDMLVLSNILRPDIGGSFDLHLTNLRKGEANNTVSQADIKKVVFDEGGSGIRDIHITKSIDQEAMIAYGVGGSGFYRKVSVNGTGIITLGNERDFYTGAHGGSLTTGTRVAHLGNDWFVLVSSDGSGWVGASLMKDGSPGTNFMSAWLIDGQGASPVNYGPFILPGSVTMFPMGTDMVSVGTDKFAVSYSPRYVNPTEDTFFVIGERSGSVINFGSTRKLNNHAARGTLFEIDANNVGNIQQQGPGGSEDGPYVSIIEVTGTCADVRGLSGFPDPEDFAFFPVGVAMSANKMIFCDALRPGGGAEWPTFQLGDLDVKTPGQAKGFGAQLSYDGNQAFVTYSDGTDLIMGVYAVPAFSETRTVNLGAGTIAQVDAGTVSAYPHVTYGRSSLDGTVWLFGRMTTVPDIGTLTHIARSTNSGANWTAVETGWGSDHAAGVVKDWNGFTYNAIRNLSTGGAAYYRGVNNMFIINTLPYQVDPRGFVITSDGYLVAGASGTVGGVRLGYTSPGLPFWYDFSYNFPTDGTVTGLQVL